MVVLLVYSAHKKRYLLLTTPTTHRQLQATMKFSTSFAILFGVAVAAVPGVVSAEVS
jgi:hypothetical protein